MGCRRGKNVNWRPRSETLQRVWETRPIPLRLSVTKNRRGMPRAIGCMLVQAQSHSRSMLRRRLDRIQDQLTLPTRPCRLVLAPLGPR